MNKTKKCLECPALLRINRSKPLCAKCLIMLNLQLKAARWATNVFTHHDTFRHFPDEWQFKKQFEYICITCRNAVILSERSKTRGPIRHDYCIIKKNNAQDIPIKEIVPINSKSYNPFKD